MKVPSLNWPTRGLPRVERAGNWPLDDRGFGYGYLCPTHALHIYDYTAQVRIGSHEVAVRPGDATLTPAGSESRYDLPLPGRHWCVHFFPEPAAGERVVLPLHVPLGAHRLRMIDGVRRMAALLALRKGPQQVVVEAAASATMLAVLLELAAMAPGAVSAAHVATPEGQLAAAAAFIEEHLGEALVVPDLAATIGLSQNYLARRFRARYGTTLHGYQLARRVEHAQLLLESTDVPVGRIADRLGFSDLQHFNKQFRRLTGINPTTFRTLGRKSGGTGGQQDGGVGRRV